MKKSKPEPIPVMDYRQYRRARRLVHECCNYDGGNCIALDDGEECVCVQSISYSLLCRWFRAAVLPLDRELETALFHRLDAKRCAVCGALFTPGSNRAKYCPECAGRMKRIKAAQRKRKQRAKCHALGAENPLQIKDFFEGVGGGLIDLSSDPQNGPLNAYRSPKRTPRRNPCQTIENITISS